MSFPVLGSDSHKIFKQKPPKTAIDIDKTYCSYIFNVWYLLVMCSFSYSRHDRYCVVGIIEKV